MLEIGVSAPNASKDCGYTTLSPEAVGADFGTWVDVIGILYMLANKVKKFLFWAGRLTASSGWDDGDLCLM